MSYRSNFYPAAIAFIILLNLSQGLAGASSANTEPGSGSDPSMGGSEYYDAEDKAILKQQLTADAIAAARASLRASLAESVGVKVERLSVNENAGPQQFDDAAAATANMAHIGKRRSRKLLQVHERVDRTSLAITAAQDAIRSAISGAAASARGSQGSAASTAAATKWSSAYARLAGQESARPLDFLP